MRREVTRGRARESGRQAAPEPPQGWEPPEDRLTWPFKAEDDTVRDANGRFVAAAESGNTARLLAAAPWLYLAFRAAKTIMQGSLEPGRVSQADMEAAYNRCSEYYRRCEMALEDFRP